jgi:hypothetical protein
MLRTLAWYFARIWIQVTPTRMLWWPSGRLDEPPREWTVPESTSAPPSDLAPPGRQPASWSEHPSDWHEAAEIALKELPFRDLSFVGTDGFPVCLPVTEISLETEGFRLNVARLADTSPEGPACLTFHDHDAGFSYQQNRVLVGRVSPMNDGTSAFDVERLLGDWSLPGGRLATTIDFMFRKGRRLRPRLKAESARRGQPVPKVRFPEEVASLRGVGP